MTNLSKTFIKNILSTAADEIAALGIAYRKQGVFTRSLRGDFLGWLGLNHALCPDESTYEINVVVGVRSQSLERLLAEIRQTEFHDYNPPSISTHLGYLTPKNTYTPFLFMESINPLEKIRSRTTLRRMKHLINEFAVPFMEQNSDIESLLQRMQDDLGYPHQLMFRIPLALYMLGRKRDAEQYLATQVERASKQVGKAAEDYLVFSKAVTTHFK